MSEKNKQEPISKRIKNNQKYMENRVGVGTSFDVGFRSVKVLGTVTNIYYCTGLCDSTLIAELMKKMIEINDVEKDKNKVFEIIENRLVHQQVSKTKTMDEITDQVLSGLVAILIDGEQEAFIVDVRHYPGRTPQEPDTEKVIRGSRDGFTENIIENTALTRRRIRDERLRNEILQVGERSKTDICISYIKDVADEGLVKLIRDKLKNIEIDGIPMADKTVEEFLVKQGLNPFPQVRYTERPDVASTHLLEGHVLVMVDTSPSMIITPTTYFHHVQHAEEYRQSPVIGTFVRWTRFIGIILSIFLMPFWLLMVMEPSLLPKTLQYIGPNEVGNIPIFVQIIIADMGLEFLRIAAIHTPTPLATAMGLIAAVLIGQIAVDVGLFSPEVILYVSISAIGTYSTPSYELSVSNRICRLMLLVVVAIFGVKGFVIGSTLYIMLLARATSLKTPYLWPFLPFNFSALLHVLVRTSVPLSNHRPSIVHPRNNYSQPKN